MAEKIGLEAVLQLGSFSIAVRQYNQAISGMSKNTASTASSISSSFVGLGSGILKVGAIAAGAGLAGITALTAGLVILGSTALTEFAKYERMSLSIQSLVARELSQGKLVEQQRTVAISLTKKEAQELEGLAGKIKDEELARNTLHARIKEQSEALRQLRDAHGDEALDVQTATARLAELENQYNKSGVEIQGYKDRQIELTNKTGEYTTVLEKVRTGQMSMTEAMTQASPRAQELLSWISKLAVLSPFTEEGIQNAFQTALAYGFTTEQAQRLTQAEVDFTAATGKNIEQANLIALALGQMQAKGKVSGQELIQLTNAGVGVNKILEDMGFTLDDVSNGLVSSEAFIEAVIKDMEIFQGAAKNQANTFSGLISTLSDLKAIGLREFFTGTFTAIQPYLAEFVGFLTNAALETGSIRALGDAFGTYVVAGLEKVSTIANKLIGSFQRFGIRGAGVSLLGQLGLSPEGIAQVMSVADQVVEAIGKIQGAFERFGFKGAVVSLLGQLGMDPETIATLRTVIGEVTEIVSGFVARISEFVGNLSFEEIIGGLTGIGTVLAGGVLAALVAGLLSLLTPINLIIAGAALLGAAWAGNWGGIQEKTGAVVTYVTEQINSLREALTPAFNSIYDSLSRLSEAFNGAGVNSESMKNALGAIGTFVIETAIPAFVKLAGILADTLAMQIKGITDGMIAGHNAFVLVSDYISGTVIPTLTNLQVWIADKTNVAIKTMADLWTNTLQPALLAINDKITLVSGLLESLGNVSIAITNKALEALAGWAETTLGNLETMGKYLSSTFSPIIEKLSKWFSDKLQPSITKVGQFLKDTLAPGFASTGGTVKEDVLPVLNTLAETTLPLLEEGVKIVTDAIKRMTDFFNSMAAAVDKFKLPDVLTPGSPPPMAIALMDIAKGADMASGAIQQMGKATNDLSKSAIDTLMTGLRVTDESFIHRFVDEVDIGGALRARNVNRRSALGKGISDALKAGLGGFVTNLQSSPELSDVTAFVEQIAVQWGRSLSSVADKVDIPTLYKSIKAKFDELWGKLRVENLANAIGIAQGFAGIGASFGDMLKEQMEGFNQLKEESAKLGEENTKLTDTVASEELQLAKLRTELAKLTTGAGSNALSIEKITESLAFGERQLAIYQEELAKLAEGSLDWDKKKLAIDRLTESMDMQQKQLEKLTAASDIDIISIQKKQQEIAKLTEEINKNKEAIEKNEIALSANRKELQRRVLLAARSDATAATRLAGDLAEIELLKEFLAGSGDIFKFEGRDLNDPLVQNIGYMGSRVEVQKELNRLLAEQAKREQDILNIEKAQKQLDFLNQQISLLKMLSDRGLNPRDILGGIKLGLDASIPDLLAATNKVVQAMVNQINSDLQIASPSKVMIRVGSRFVAGMALGIERGRNMLSNAVSSLLLLNGSLPQPVFNQAGGTSSSVQNTYNYNFPMTVSTSATAQGVIRQYEIKRSMYAN